MRTRRSLTITALVLGAIATAGSAHAATATAPAFSNGSFEAPTAPVGSFTTIGAGQSIGPWTVTRGNVDLIGARFWAAADGDQSVDLDGNTMGAVSQTFATNPGTPYTVTYSLAGNPAGGPATKTGEVLVNGQDVQDFSFDTTGQTFLDMGYETDQVTFLATSPSSTLTFESTTLGAYGPVLDNVRVTANCCPRACS